MDTENTVRQTKMMDSPNGEIAGLLGNNDQESEPDVSVGSSSSTGQSDCNSEEDEQIKVSKDEQMIVSKDEQMRVSKDEQMRVSATNHREGQMSSYPVFDMREKQCLLVKQDFKKFKNSSKSEEKLKQEVVEAFKTDVDNVEIITKPGSGEGTPKKTAILILPDVLQDEVILLVDIVVAHTSMMDDFRCIHLSKYKTIQDLSELAKVKLEMKGVQLCKEQFVLNGSNSIGECGFKNFDKIQIVEKCLKHLTVLYRPIPGAKSEYYLTTNSCFSVNNFRQQFLNKYGPYVALQHNQTVHFLSGGKLLRDAECIGLVTRPGSEDTLGLQIGPPNAICIKIKSKSERGKPKLATPLALVVPPECSTADLRAEVAKHLQVDPKAVKLVIDDKRVDELSSFQKMLRLQNGTVVEAGIKKQKKLCIKHPKNHKEVVIKLYMLETVHALKMKCVEAFRNGMKLKHIMLKCRDIEMKDHEFLQNYPLKNGMALHMELYEKRLLVDVNVIFLKEKLCVVVDDADKTTVDDLLEFCAQKLKYRRECSRCIYQGQCLYKRHSLAQVGLECGRTVYIVEFPQAADCQTGMNDAKFEVDSEGQINVIHVIVKGCRVYRAIPDVTIPNVEEKEEICSRVPLPTGIHILDKSLDQMSGPIREQHKSTPDKSGRKKSNKHVRAADKEHQLQKYLCRGREACNRIRRESHRDSICSTCSSQNGVNTNTEAPKTDPCCTPEVIFHNPPDFAEDSTYWMNCSEDHSSDLSIVQKRRLFKKNVSFSDDKDSSNQESDDTTLSEIVDDSPIRVPAPGQATHTDLTEGKGFVEFDSEDSHQREVELYRPRRRRRRQAPGAGYHGDLNRLCHSCPVMRRIMHGSTKDLSLDFSATGIPPRLLHSVAEQLGSNWKKLARQLELPDFKISALEHDHKGLVEVSYQALLEWQQVRGHEATVEALIAALKGIKMVALADWCEEASANRCEDQYKKYLTS